MPRHPLYDKVNKKSKAMGERRDCSVIAVAIVCNLPYEYVHPIFTEKGRTERQGTYMYTTRAVLRHLNVWYESLPEEQWFGKTFRTFERNCPRNKRYLLSNRTHMLACVNGEVIDWAQNRLHRLTDVWEITF